MAKAIYQRLWRIFFFFFWPSGKMVKWELQGKGKAV